MQLRDYTQQKHIFQGISNSHRKLKVSKENNVDINLKLMR